MATPRRLGRLAIQLTALFAVLTYSLSQAHEVRAETSTGWHFEPALAPPPPAGVTAAPYSVPIGRIGEISFWAPNRGLLITGGTEEAWGGPVAAGLYTYDGEHWRQLSTVCGGGEGKIAWAGPDEFWTIAEQREGQLLSGADTALQRSISLCHFLDGQVVGSYAMPAEQPDSYLPMDAAACHGPNDCWFGGEDGVGPEGVAGAFHLHWNGSTVTAVFEPEDHAVADMVNFGGTIYESVQIASTDAHLAEESVSHPPTPIHTIAPAGALPTFSDVPLLEGANRLPRYGAGVLPQALNGFSLGSDGGPLGEGATQLWAAANPVPTRPGLLPASLTVLRYAGGSWSQLIPAANGSSPLPAGTTLAGALRTYAEGNSLGVDEAAAPEPGAARAWLSINATNPAEVALLNANGTLVEIDKLPSAQEPVGPRGSAGPIVCPASHDCWMATNGGGSSLPGWLFHLTNGTQYSLNTDPYFAHLITYRPPDNGVPVIYPDVPPADDSLANQQSAGSANGPPLEVATPAPPLRGKAKRLVLHARSKLLHGRTVQLSFTLTAAAHVRLIARRHGAVVARTPMQTLRPGPHRLSLRLDPARWPTGFKFQATPIGASSSGESSESSSGDTVSTG
jgi:hypothetical protein